jgi:Phage derived protein Gp49-like (DUF891)
MGKWNVGQFGNVVDRFRAECPRAAWDDVILRYSVLVEKGHACGRLVAKQLVNGKGIWELLGHAGNIQPRLLFYFADERFQIVFVHAFIKQGTNEYKRAIQLAQSRRKLIESGERPLHVINEHTFKATRIH